jgi:hypothetical protein
MQNRKLDDLMEALLNADLGVEERLLYYKVVTLCVSVRWHGSLVLVRSTGNPCGTRLDSLSTDH